MKQADEDGPEAGGDPGADGEVRSHAITRFVQEHPAIVVAGGVALGVLAAALVPRRNREFVAEKSSALLDGLGAAGLMLVREAIERAETAGEGLRNGLGRMASATADEAKGQGDRPTDGPDLPNILASLFRHFQGRSQG